MRNKKENGLEEEKINTKNSLILTKRKIMKRIFFCFSQVTELQGKDKRKTFIFNNWKKLNKCRTILKIMLSREKQEQTQCVCIYLFARKFDLNF